MANAHCVYIVPTNNGKGISIVFSDHPGPDKSVPITKFASTKLSLRADGKDNPLKREQVENHLVASIHGEEVRVDLSQQRLTVVPFVRDQRSRPLDDQ